MPSAKSLKRDRRARILLVGEPGMGKTSSLASLAEAGYRLFVASFDDNIDALLHRLSDEAAERVYIEILQDRIAWDRVKANRKANVALTPSVRGEPKAFATLIKLLDNWVDSETGESFGPVAEMGPKDILVIDPLTHLSHAIFDYTLYAGARLGYPKRKADWGRAIDREVAFVRSLCSIHNGANLIVTCHLKRLRVKAASKEEVAVKGSAADIVVSHSDDEEDEILTAEKYPSALGQNLPAEIGGFFGAVIQADMTAAGKFILRTRPTKDVRLKIPATKLALPAELPAEDGLVKIVNCIVENR